MFTQMCKKYINIYYVRTWRRNIRCKVWNEKRKSPFSFYFLSDSSQSEKKKKEKKLHSCLKQQFYRDNDVASRYRISGIKLSERTDSIDETLGVNSRW